MDILKFIKEHDAYLKENTVYDKITLVHSKALEILRHERMIHLIVTMFSILFMLITLGEYFYTGHMALGVLFLILLGLNTGYLFHYYRLENKCLEWENIEYDFHKDKGEVNNRAQ